MNHSTKNICSSPVCSWTLSNYAYPTSESNVAIVSLLLVLVFIDILPAIVISLLHVGEVGVIPDAFYFLPNDRAYPNFPCVK